MATSLEMARLLREIQAKGRVDRDDIKKIKKLAKRKETIKKILENGVEINKNNK